MSLLWKLPNRNVSVAIVAVAALTGLVGYLAAGVALAAKAAGSVFAALLVSAWFWATAEAYTGS